MERWRVRSDFELMYHFGFDDLSFSLSRLVPTMSRVYFIVIYNADV